jgi:hypothetical protein
VQDAIPYYYLVTKMFTEGALAGTSVTHETFSQLKLGKVYKDLSFLPAYQVTRIEKVEGHPGDVEYHVTGRARRGRRTSKDVSKSAA